MKIFSYLTVAACLLLASLSATSAQVGDAQERKKQRYTKAKGWGFGLKK